MKLYWAAGCLFVMAIFAGACSSGGDLASGAQDAPFDDVLIELFGTTDTELYLSQAERAAAELVVTCMADAGFEFQIPPAPNAFVPPDPADLEAARTDGFGIIAGIRHQVAQTDPAIQQAPDPNVIYVSTLPPAEFDRFFFTLDGADPEPGQQREGGCNTEASDQAYADWKRFFDALPNFTALGEERDTHPDWLAARSTWRACMVDRGFDYAEPDAIRTDVISRMREAVNQVYPGGQVPPSAEVDGVVTVDPQVDILLEELLQFEQAAAVANVECTTPVAEIFDGVEQEVQQGFVDRNRAAIDELLAASS